MKKKPSWETLYKRAERAVEEAYAATNDLAGWSGASGNWGLQDANERLRKARLAFTEAELTKPETEYTITCNGRLETVRGRYLTGMRIRELCCGDRPEQVFAEKPRQISDRLIADSDTVDLSEEDTFYSAPSAIRGG